MTELISPYVYPLILGNKPKEQITMQIIAEKVADYFQIPLIRLFEKNRKTEVVYARHMVYHIATITLPKQCRTKIFMGKFFKQDHTTVINGLNAIQDRLDTIDETKADVMNILIKLNRYDANNF
jgi:chromosomal replication initiation ATPase DnaA